MMKKNYLFEEECKSCGLPESDCVCGIEKYYGD